MNFLSLFLLVLSTIYSNVLLAQIVRTDFGSVGTNHRNISMLPINDCDSGFVLNFTTELEHKRNTSLSFPLTAVSIGANGSTAANRNNLTSVISFNFPHPVSDFSLRIIDLDDDTGGGSAIEEVLSNFNIPPTSVETGLSISSGQVIPLAADRDGWIHWNGLNTDMISFRYNRFTEKYGILLDSISFSCRKAPSDCCAKVEAIFAPCEPVKDLLHGKFTITNLNPSSPICKVTISATPAASFTNSGLMIDGGATLPGSYWNPAMIPSTGVISPAAVNTIMFNLAVDISYSGNIQVTVIKCDSTMCTFPIKWKGNSGPKATISPVAVPVQVETGYGLSAFQFRLIGKGNNPIAAKYCAVGLPDTVDQPSIFAISGAIHSADSFPSYLEPVELAQMGNSNAFFGMVNVRPLKDGDSSKIFNLVLKVKKEKGKTTPLRITLLDGEGGIIYSDTVEVPNLTTDVTTSIIKIDDKFQMTRGVIMQVYPNPAYDKLNLEYINPISGTIKLELLTITGEHIQDIMNSKVESGIHKLSIDISKLVNGIYLVKLYTKSNISTIRFEVIK
jgi:hypothetical protein